MTRIRKKKKKAVQESLKINKDSNAPKLPAPRNYTEGKMRETFARAGLKPGAAAAQALSATTKPDMRGPGDAIQKQMQAYKAFDKQVRQYNKQKKKR